MRPHVTHFLLGSSGALYHAVAHSDIPTYSTRTRLHIHVEQSNRGSLLRGFRDHYHLTDFELVSLGLTLKLKPLKLSAGTGDSSHLRFYSVMMTKLKTHSS